MRVKPAKRCRACPNLRPCPTHPETTGWASAHQHAGEYKTPEYRRLRLQVLAEETHCWICGGTGMPDDEADHKVALSRGGRTTREGLARAHRACNRAAGARLGVETQRVQRG